MWSERERRQYRRAVLRTAVREHWGEVLCILAFAAAIVLPGWGSR
jgi:hypothetical protein